MVPPHRNLERVKLAHVRRAARTVGADGTGYPPFRRSTTYDAFLPGGTTPYPPKALIARAYELATGVRLVPSDFAGAREGYFVTRLEELGCVIRDKPDGAPGRAGTPQPKRTAPTGTPAAAPSSALETDVEALLQRARVPKSVQRVVLARIGQGAFRADLIAYWKGACAVTGVTERAVLRASHIKRWADSADHERGDVDNGLLLRADIDALFEVGLIRFKDDGRIDLSRLSPQTAADLGLHHEMRLRRKPNAAQRAYLAQHRARFSPQDEVERAFRF
ncbi:hypothetical protein RPSD_52660 (plasmid) [Ralstonia solanacearum]|nr:hypothetical protein RPSD_52660 [Ralstonia solanacearum]